MHNVGLLVPGPFVQLSLSFTGILWGLRVSQISIIIIIHLLVSHLLVITSHLVVALNVQGWHKVGAKWAKVDPRMA